MNCGNCHPLDIGKHMNGVVEVELYNTLSPAGSLKAKNPAGAGYTPGGTVYYDSRGLPFTLGTCSNVYCHSYNDWTTPGGVPQSTDCSSYLPPNLVTTRFFKTPTWGGTLDCTGCHANPPKTSYPANDGGAGNSHAWIDPYGYEDLHNYNMGFAPVSCRYCHNDTLKQLNTWTRDAMDVSTLSQVPIDNYARHVNGSNDVAFDRANKFVYRSITSVTGGTYDTASKTCSNVSCHLKQTTVKWGTPYRFYYQIECDRCHKYAGLCP
jgi:predicted CxxxxCH...CXXCH cytochrome family protein